MTLDSKKDLQNNMLNKIMFYFILLQPVIDVFTSFNENYFKLPISLGIAVRALFLIASVIMTIYYGFRNKKWLNLLYLFLVSGYCVIYLGASLLENSTHVFMVDMMGLVKTFYFCYVMILFMTIYEQLDISKIKQAVVGCISMYTVSIVVAVLTGTSFSAYKLTGSGYVGWFYAGNEVGAILAMLIPLLSSYLFMKNKLHWTHLVLGLCACLGTTLVGVRTVFLAVIIFLVLCVVWGIINIIFKGKSTEYNKKLYIKTIVGSLVLLCVINVSYHMSFIKENMASHEIEQSVTEEETSTKSELENNAVFERLNLLLNHRLTYMIPKLDYYQQSDLPYRLLGIGYTHGEGENESEKLIEIDFLDIFMGHGYIGTLLYFTPIIIGIFKYLFLYFRRFSKNIKNLEICVYLYSFFIGIGISITAGHLFTAPAVSIYLAIMMIFIHDYYVRKNG